ncbi:MAG: hypothetical protein AAF802_00370 [Planctomycetota bacterium]
MGDLVSIVVGDADLPRRNLCIHSEPFAEEPWLLQLHGEDYRTYCQRVPRFIGYRSL